YEVYRFGGRHIGWLTGGILRDSAGDGVCAVRSMVGNPQPEPPKPQPPQAEPPRILRDPAPRPPAFSREWSHTDCETFLAAER
ncbi:MAG TPA: hypothetical protein VM491_01430, partial [Burkholderiaceae bacterium]|nr:hypothetical protein [Burkholderiaceae bacterium]